MMLTEFHVLLFLVRQAIKDLHVMQPETPDQMHETILWAVFNQQIMDEKVIFSSLEKTLLYHTLISNSVMRHNGQNWNSFVAKYYLSRMAGAFASEK
jgi:hypothetical protein